MARANDRSAARHGEVRMIVPLALFILCMLCMFGLGLLVIDWIRDEIKQRRKDQQELRVFIGYIEGANDDAQAKQIADSLPPSGAVLPPALSVKAPIRRRPNLLPAAAVPVKPAHHAAVP
jgi:hypothetical protein